MTISNHLALLAVVTTGIGAVMLLLGLRSGLLLKRAARRRCPSCGHIMDAPVCNRCVG
jgi:hypothetical protein